MTEAQAPKRHRPRVAAGLSLTALSFLALWAALASGDAVLTQPLRLEHGIRLERAEFKTPRSRLIVARVPRRQKLRLHAALLSEKQKLVRLAPAAKSLGALVATNGDYHRLGGHCLAGTYSTLVEGGRVRVLGSPFSYAAAFWLDDAGQPRIGKLNLRCLAQPPTGPARELFLNLEQGNLVLVDRCPKGTWRARGYLGFPVSGSLAKRAIQIEGPLKARLKGPSLLLKIGSKDEAELRGLAQGQTLKLDLQVPPGGVQLAIGTGPRLLEAGAIHADARLDTSGWTGRYGRAAVGFNGEELLLVTTIRKATDALSMLDFAQALKELGCLEALNLDGGPSTTLWAQGATQNLPRGRRADRVASGLFVLPPGEGVSLQ